MKEIPLTRGYVAWVDDDDFDRVRKYKWQADVSRDGLRVYAITTLIKPERRNIRLHRLVLNATEGQLVDHIGGNSTTLDCRKHNLRFASKGLNAANSKPRINGSGHRGVCFHPQTRKWRASFVVDGKRISLGLFTKKEDAASTVRQALQNQWGLI